RAQGDLGPRSLRHFATYGATAPGFGDPLAAHYRTGFAWRGRACLWVGPEFWRFRELLELVQDVRELLGQVLDDRRVVEELPQVCDGQDQVERVLAVGLLDHQEVLAEQLHLPLHAGNVLGTDAREDLLLVGVD